jgi:hypothetical protein
LNTRFIGEYSLASWNIPTLDAIKLHDLEGNSGITRLRVALGGTVHNPRICITQPERNAMMYYLEKKKLEEKKRKGEMKESLVRLEPEPCH